MIHSERPVPQHHIKSHSCGHLRHRHEQRIFALGHGSTSLLMKQQNPLIVTLARGSERTSPGDRYCSVLLVLYLPIDWFTIDFHPSESSLHYPQRAFGLISLLTCYLIPTTICIFVCICIGLLPYLFIIRYCTKILAFTVML